jgi:protein phosphatase
VLVVDLLDGDSVVPSNLGPRVVRGPSATGIDMAGFTAIASSATPHAGTGSPATDDPSAGVVSDPLDDPDGTGRTMLPKVVAGPRDRLARRVTWRTLLFLLAFLGVFVVAAVAVVWYGNNGYFVSTNDAGEISVFEGRPGGFLWFEPEEVESTGVDIDELTPVLRDSIEAVPEFGTLEEARAYLVNVADQQGRANAATPSSTPPSTLATTTTTATSSGAP